MAASEDLHSQYKFEPVNLKTMLLSYSIFLILLWEQRKKLSNFHESLHFYFTKLGTAGKVSKYEFVFGPCFLVFGLNTRKYGPEKTPYLDTFHAVWIHKHW